jgi:2-keto-4-pentenoate hydratase/2-oxohepta-3-ene-1,7-dioic acid hydratase in catechol pathway
MVRGSELFAALARCGETGLGIRLDVDEGEGFRPRQDATTAAMILDPVELLAKIAEVVGSDGLHTAMPVKRAGRTVYYPLAVDSQGPRLPAGSVVLTGTPEGIALQAPSNALAVTARGLLHKRSPIEQFVLEERERATGAEPGGYLRPGQRVRAAVDGLGAQVVRIADAGATALPDPCGD